MTDMPENPTMQEILLAFHLGEINRCLDDLEKSFYMVRRLAILDDIAETDPDELREYVQVICWCAERLSGSIDQAIEISGPINGR